MSRLREFLKESNMIEGVTEVSDEEIDAANLFLENPNLHYLSEYVMVTAGAMLRTKPNMNVRVGNHVAPKGGEIIQRNIEVLLEKSRESITQEMAYYCHVSYETLHPYMDGNGRSGRLIWYYQMNENAPLGFLHHWYYQTLAYSRRG